MEAKGKDVSRLFIVVVPIGRQHHNHNFRGMNVIYETVLLRDASAPTFSSETAEWFWMPRAVEGWS